MSTDNNRNPPPSEISCAMEKKVTYVKCAKFTSRVRFKDHGELAFVMYTLCRQIPIR